MRRSALCRLKVDAMTPLRHPSKASAHLRLFTARRSPIYSPFPRLSQVQHHIKRSYSTSSTGGPEAHQQPPAPAAPRAIRRVTAMDPSTREQYLADSPPTVVKLEIKPHFEALKDERLKRYAHFMSRLAFLTIRSPASGFYNTPNWPRKLLCRCYIQGATLT